MNSGTKSNALDPVLSSSVNLVTPVALILGIYLLFAGHNNPGGGFAAGLVFGAIVILRNLAGFKNDINPTPVITVGVLVVVAVSAVPLVAGFQLLDQAVVELEVPILGKLKSGSALPFDIGVTAIVVGLVAGFLRGLNASPSGSLLGDRS